MEQDKKKNPLPEKLSEISLGAEGKLKKVLYRFHKKEMEERIQELKQEMKKATTSEEKRKIKKGIDLYEFLSKEETYNQLEEPFPPELVVKLSKLSEDRKKRFNEIDDQIKKIGDPGIKEEEKYTLEEKKQIVKTHKLTHEAEEIIKEAEKIQLTPEDKDQVKIIRTERILELYEKEKKTREKAEAKIKKLEEERVVEEKQLLFPDFDFVEKAKGLPRIPIDKKIYSNLPDVIPYRLTKKDYIGKTKISTGGYLIQYRKEIDRGKDIKRTITWSFRIPENAKIEGIPTYGNLANECYYGSKAFAIAQKSIRPVFRSSDMLRFWEYSEEEMKHGQLFVSMCNIFRTFAYTTIEIIDTKNGKSIREEIGHLFDKIILDTKNKYICTVLNEDDQKLHGDYLEGKKQIPYIGYPTPKQLKSLSDNQDLDIYNRKLTDWTLKYKNFKRKMYPVTVNYLITKVFRFPKSYIHKLGGKARVLNDISQRIEKGKQRKLYSDYKFVALKSGKNIFKSKIQFDFSLPKPEGKTEIQEIANRVNLKMLQSDYEILANEMTEFCYNHFQNIRDPKEKFYEQILNTIKVRDIDQCKLEFEDFKTEHFREESNLTPWDLFQRLKALSRKAKDIK